MHPLEPTHSSEEELLKNFRQELKDLLLRNNNSTIEQERKKLRGNIIGNIIGIMKLIRDKLYGIDSLPSIFSSGTVFYNTYLNDLSDEKYTSFSNTFSKTKEDKKLELNVVKFIANYIDGKSTIEDFAKFGLQDNDNTWMTMIYIHLFIGTNKNKKPSKTEKDLILKLQLDAIERIKSYHTLKILKVFFSSNK